MLRDADPCARQDAVERGWFTAECSRRGGVDYGLALALAEQVADGMACLHANNIVHGVRGARGCGLAGTCPHARSTLIVPSMPPWRMKRADACLAATCARTALAWCRRRSATACSMLQHPRVACNEVWGLARARRT